MSPWFASKELARFTTFVIIGIINTVLDTSLWHFLASFFAKKNLQFPLALNRYAVAHALSFTISATSSFFMNRFWTWRDTDNYNFSSQLFKFYLVAVFSLAIGTILMNFLTKLEPKFLLTFQTSDSNLTENSKNFSFSPFVLQSKQWPLICKILTIGVTTFTNYFGYNLFVF